MLNNKKNSDRSDFKQLLSIASNHLKFLKTERDNILHHSKRVDKLYDKVLVAHSRLHYSTSIIIGEPISLKELKTRSSSRENKLIKYILINDRYIQTINELNKLKRKVDIYIKMDIFTDKEDRTFKEWQLINQIQIVLKRRYLYCENTREIACFMNADYYSLWRRYKSIL